MAQKSNSGNPNSGVSVSFRLSETLIGMCLSAGIAFGSGWAYANQNVNVNQVDCSVRPTQQK